MFNLRNFLNLNYYTSHLDEFLAKFKRENPKPSQSQQQEIDKYRRIHQLRDCAKQEGKPQSSIWDNF